MKRLLRVSVEGGQPLTKLFLDLVEEVVLPHREDYMACLQWVMTTGGLTSTLVYWWFGGAGLTLRRCRWNNFFTWLCNMKVMCMDADRVALVSRGE